MSDLPTREDGGIDWSEVHKELAVGFRKGRDTLDAIIDLMRLTEKQAIERCAKVTATMEEQFYRDLARLGQGEYPSLKDVADEIRKLKV